MLAIVQKKKVHKGFQKVMEAMTTYEKLKQIIKYGPISQSGDIGKSQVLLFCVFLQPVAEKDSQQSIISLNWSNLKWNINIRERQLFCRNVYG